MAIRWHFERDKLTEREAQLLRAMIDLHFHGQMLMVQATAVPHEPPRRSTQEEIARLATAALRGALPDLDIRWTWEP